MKPLPEEIAIEKIFKIASQRGFKVPELLDVQFCCKSGILGMANKQVIYISTNYPGEMSCNNPRFVETVCHELIHYNGIMNHGESFWLSVRTLKENVLKTLKEEMNGCSQINENSQTS